MEQLEGVARNELKSKKPEERKRVYLSFRHTDKDKVNALRAQAKQENSTLDFIDMSLQTPFNSENAEYIKSGIRSRIQQSSATLVMVSDNTYESEWVNWEVQETLNQGKRVIAIDVRSSSKVKMPDSILDNRTKIKTVRWDHQEIMNALNETPA